VTLLATAGHDLLPAIMRGHNYTPAMIVVVSLVWTLSLVAGLILFLRRPHTVLDLWLIVVMCAWLFDIALSAVLNAGRFDVGFYAGRIYGLVAATVVLIILLLETGSHYAQLARLLAAEQIQHRRDAEERRRIFETSLDLILVVDRQRNFLRVSPSARTILGYEPVDMVGRNAVDFLYPDDLDPIRAEMRRARRGHTIRNFLTRYIHKDGHIVMLEWTGVWSEPEQRHFFIGRDVTEQKRIERIKDEFIATVNHELRTPATAIAASLTLLTNDVAGKLPEQVSRLISMAQSNCRKLAALLNDILDFETIASGKMTFNFGQVDLISLLDRAIAAMRPFARTLGVTLRFDALPTACTVETDSERLTQVMGNILSNAIKFSPTGGDVIISVAEQEDFYRIAVRDHGPGIPDEYKARIFERFIQVDASDARKRGGAGLGLAIVKELVVRLGGRVGCHDAPSGGSIFHVDLPRAVRQNQVRSRADDSADGVETGLPQTAAS
jgi:PAS domain S-box-containing protein